MTVKLMTELNLEFLSLKEAAQARLSRNATLLEITFPLVSSSLSYTLRLSPKNHAPHMNRNSST